MWYLVSHTKKNFLTFFWEMGVYYFEQCLRYLRLLRYDMQVEGKEKDRSDIPLIFAYIMDTTFNYAGAQHSTLP